MQVAAYVKTMELGFKNGWSLLELDISVLLALITTLGCSESGSWNITNCTTAEIFSSQFGHLCFKLVWNRFNHVHAPNNQRTFKKMQPRRAECHPHSFFKCVIQWDMKINHSFKKKRMKCASPVIKMKSIDKVFSNKSSWICDASCSLLKYIPVYLKFA